MMYSVSNWESTKGALKPHDRTLKAWQALTHPAGSPTWRNCSRNLTEKQRQGFGWFRPNREVMDAWKETRRVAEALRARVCVLQTPASFSSASDNEKNLRRFFSQIDRGNLELAWEPRGDWNDKPDQDSADMVQVVGISMLA